MNQRNDWLTCKNAMAAQVQACDKFSQRVRGLLILLPLLLVFLFGGLISPFAQPFFSLLEFNSPTTGPAAIGCSLVQPQRTPLWASWLAGWLCQRFQNPWRALHTPFHFSARRASWGPCVCAWPCAKVHLYSGSIYAANKPSDLHSGQWGYTSS